VARNLYILAGALLLFALVSFILSMTSGHMQQALPASGTLWKTTALFLTVGGLVVALLGIMTALFEQIDRRTEERQDRRQGTMGRRGPQRLDR
jgi:membrane protein implicated in regulation of membrane protease activity